MISPTIDELISSLCWRQSPFLCCMATCARTICALRQGRLYLFDWPAITAGRAEWDMVAFARSVTVEGGVAPEQVMAWYAEEFPVDAAVVDSSIAFWFAFFAN